MKRMFNDRIGIPILMTLSGLLLTGFVVQWLYSQKLSLEAKITKDVRSDLNKSADQLLDKLLLDIISDTMVYLYEPESINLNQSNQHLSKIATNVALSKSDTLKSETYINIQLDDKRSITNLKRSEIAGDKKQFIKRDSANSTVMMQISPAETRVSIDKRAFLTHSLKVIVERMQRDFPNEELFAFQNAKLDTMKFKRLLAKNWQHKGLEYQFQLLSDSLSDTKTPTKSGIYTDNLIFGKRIGIALTNRNYYVFLQLLPQLLFGFALLLITTGSFTIAYRSYRKQVQINELRGHFMNNISHELKTPVSTVLVALEALQHYNRKNDPKIMDEYLQLMSLEVTRLDKLVHQVLINGQLELKKNFLNREQTNLVLLIDQVIHRYQLKIDETGATINFLKPDSAIFLALDPIHMQGVIGNLLENALNYATPHPIIEIELQQLPTAVCILLSDNGPGIDEAYFDQLFTQFFRVPTGNTHNVKGYGLGLSYCKQIMLQHGGAITVINLPSGGCQFQLTFPTNKR